MVIKASADIIKNFDSYHEYMQKKQKLQDQYLQRLQNQPSRVNLQKNTSNLFRHRRKRNNSIDVRSLNKVIAVDPIQLVAEVEGMTTYADLVDATLAYNCLPTVVPELKSITVGGALSGIGIESSSFRYGLVHETVSEFDALLGDARIVTSHSKNDYADLYYAFPNSYGTLGYALRLKIQLIPVKKYIQLTHHHFPDPQAFFTQLQFLCLQNREQGPISYVEGVVFDQRNLVISVAEFVDEAPYTSNYRYMNIYYQSLLKKKIDYLTTEDYIWRWDPDWFWCSKVFGMQNPILRLLLGKWLLKSTVYWKLMHQAHHNPLLRQCIEWFAKPTESVIQDVAVPIDKAEDFLAFFNQQIGIKPVWICPVKAYRSDVQFNLFRVNPETLYVNFGFWSTVPSDKEPGYYNRLIENKVQQLEGNKSLYSSAYYTEEQFWKIYDKTLYNKLKSKYDPRSTLSNLYEKCTERG